MSIHQGEILGIVGGSGSGKSTLGRVLAGLTMPSAGCLNWSYEPPTRHWSRWFRQGQPHPVQMVFQDPYDSLNPVRTIRQHLSPISRRVGGRDISWVMDAVGLPLSYLERFPHQLSGGQRQRIAIARALLRKPSVLILDDATSAVDPKVEAKILQNIKIETNCSLLVVAHRLATIRLAERVIFRDDGKVVASGSHEELLQIEDYANLVNAYEDVTL